MKSKFSAKFLSLIKPLTISSIGLIAVYSALNYILIIKYRLLDINQEYTDAFIPFVLSVLFSIHFLRPVIRLFKLGERGKDAVTFFSVALIAVPLILFQAYLERGQDEILRVSDPYKIFSIKDVNYFIISDYKVDKKRYDFNNEVVNGRHNYSVNSYYITPIVTSFENRIGKLWYCIHYQDNVSHGALKVNEKINSIIEKNEGRFLIADGLRELKCFKRIERSNEFDQFIKIIRRNTGENEFLLLEPQYEFPENDLLAWSAGLFIFSNLSLFMIFTFIPYKKRYNPERDNVSVLSLKNLKLALSFITPQKGYVFTPLSIVIMTSIFLIMIFSGVDLMIPDKEDLVRWGGNGSSLTTIGEFWRLFTCIFIHAGLLHILSNMLALVFVSLFLEPILGSIKITVIFFISGIAASISSLVFNDNVVSVGASGAIFGLYGCLIPIIMSGTISKKIPWNLVAGIVLFLGYNLLIGINGNIDNAAHIGGLLTGLLLGAVIILFKRTLQDQSSYINQ